MPELMAQGPQPGQLKRWTLVEKKVTMGGKPSSTAASLRRGGMG